MSGSFLTANPQLRPLCRIPVREATVDQGPLGHFTNYGYVSVSYANVG